MGVYEIFVEETLIANLLLLRIPPSLDGYRYIKECVKKLVFDRSKRFKTNQKLYQEVGLEINKAPKLIERSIRHAVMVCWNKNGVKEFEDFNKIYFHDDRPAPREVMILMAELIEMEWNRVSLKQEEYIATFEECEI